MLCVCAAVAMDCEGRGGQKERWLLKMIRLVGNDLTSKVSAEISPLGEVLKLRLRPVSSEPPTLLHPGEMHAWLQ